MNFDQQIRKQFFNKKNNHNSSNNNIKALALPLSSERAVVNAFSKNESLDKILCSKTSRLNKSEIIYRNNEFDLEKSQVSLLEKCENNPDKTNSLLTCVICFQNPPNAVLMECGHGGFLKFILFIIKYLSI